MLLLVFLAVAGALLLALGLAWALAGDPAVEGHRVAEAAALASIRKLS